jgi:hypothetical protein
VDGWRRGTWFWAEAWGRPSSVMESLAGSSRSHYQGHLRA